MGNYLRLLLFNIYTITAVVSFGAVPVADEKRDSVEPTVVTMSEITGKTSVWNNIATWSKRNNVLDNLDVAVTLGTTGLGIELAAPVTKWTNLRVGFDFMPKFTVPMYFDVSTYSGDNVSESFTHIKDLMYELTGEEIDERVRMNAKLNLCNFKLIVDIFPFQNNRHWHLSAGLLIGPSRIGTAVNSKEETNSLVAMNLYNRIYEKMKASEGQDPIFGDIYLSKEKYESMMRYGKVGIHIGDYKDGTPYYMTPESNGTVNARAVVNSVKPYLGFGYGGTCDKNRRLYLGFEVGASFWGGAPDVILADGVNMTRELKNVRGRVGDYLDLVKALKVLPVLSFKISYTFF